MSSTLDNLDLVGTDSTVFILCSDISHYFTNNWKSNKVISSRAIFPLFLFYKKWQPNWSFFFLHPLLILFLFLLSHILTFSFSLSPLHLFFTSYPLSLHLTLSLLSHSLSFCPFSFSLSDSFPQSYRFWHQDGWIVLPKFPGGQDPFLPLKLILVWEDPATESGNWKVKKKTGPDCKKIWVANFLLNEAQSDLNTMLDGNACPGWKIRPKFLLIKLILSCKKSSRLSTEPSNVIYNWLSPIEWMLIW